MGADRISIAAILARATDYDYQGSPSTGTKKILRLYLEVPMKLLLHGHETLSSSGGPFSWCPSNLLDGSSFTESDMPSSTLHEGYALVDKFGAVVGEWDYRLLTAMDKGRD
jgi:hypothetical protein